MQTTQPNPFSLMFQSRKFWLAMLDALVSIILLFATRFLSPSDVELTKQVIVILQPVVLILIGSIAYEDKARMENADTVATSTRIVTGDVARSQTITESKAAPVVPKAPDISSHQG